MAQVAAGLTGALDEAEVRRLCGDAAFTHADLLQRAGHVLGPTMQESTPRARVRGTWRRVHQVSVSEKAGKLAPSCSCGSPGFCRHAAALLLHWIRDRSSFAQHKEGETSNGGSMLPPIPPREESPVAEITRWLERDTMPHLREMARLRGMKASGRGKEDLIAALAPVLASPEGVDDVLAALSDDGRRVLDTLHLLEPLGPATEEEINAAYRALGGTGEAPLAVPADLGLVMVEPRSPYARIGYRVPGIVSARLPTLGNLARPVDPSLLKAEDPSGRGTVGPQLGMEELLQVVALELESGRLRRWQPTPQELELKPHIPQGWRLDPEEQNAGVKTLDLLYRRRKTRLVPLRPVLADDDLERIASATGEKVEAVALAVGLLADLGILGGADHLFVRGERMQALLGLASAARLATLSRGWLAMSYSPELDVVVGRDGPIQVSHELRSNGFPLPTSRVVAARNLVARAVGRVEPGVWYDFESFLALLLRLAPRLLSSETLPRGRTDLWIREGELAEEGADELAPLRFPFVLSVLAGPLSWLGLVDAVSRQDSPVPAFRVRPEAAVLAERQPPEVQTEERAKLAVSADLTVLVQAGRWDAQVHALLSRAGELLGVSPAGLRYRLTAERVQGVFEEGVTGPELLRVLVDRSDTALPKAARATLQRWWADYGTLRLYDDLCVIELADDYLLPELLATTSLRSSLVHTFSPRSIAVDPRAVEGLVAELARLGHAPRVLEEP